MVTKNFTNPAPIQPPSDAWWDALMSEEEKYTLPTIKPPPVVALGNSISTAFSEANGAGGRGAPGKTPAINWRRVLSVFECDETVTLQVTGYNRGGLLVKGEWLHGFVPVSHLVDVTPCTPETEREPGLARLVGQSLRLKVIECDEERGRVVLSQRAAQAANGCRNQLFETLHVNAYVHGMVTNVTDFGVFIDLGGVEGLIHVSELSWGRVRHPADILSVGEKVEAVVVSVNPELCRIALSLKRLLPNPWETAQERYRPGQINEATITCVTSFGAFARLEPGLDGLIHVSEMKLDTPAMTPADILEEGQKVQVRVINVDAVRQRLGLSLHQEV